MFLLINPDFLSLNLFLEKAPKSIKGGKVKEKILKVKDVEDIHNFKVWSLDEHNIYSLIHIVVKDDKFDKKNEIREILHEAGITNTTIEIETEKDRCGETEHIHSENCSHTHHHH